MTVNLPDDCYYSDPHAPWNDDLDNLEVVEPDYDDIDYDARRERALSIGEDE